MKLPVADVSWEERQVEAPDRCPSCGADLSLPDALLHFEYQSQARLATLDHGEIKWSTDLPDSMAEFIPLEWQCARCRAHLASGIQRFNPDP